MDADRIYEETFSIPELELLFDTSIRVFLRYGIVSSTMEDITEATGIPLNTLEENFKSKQDLAVAALRWYYLKYSQQMQSAMALHSDVYSAMQTMLMEFAELCYDELRAGKGLLWVTLIDLGYVDKDLWKEFEKQQFNWEDQIRDKFNQCRDELYDPEDIDILATYFAMTIEGIYEMAKFGTSREKLFQLIEISLEVLESRMKTGKPFS